MDISEEPQRKVFKARKTMKASDRQQLETIHKAKEELLKPAELTLINGNHENCDLDKNFVHNTDSLGDRNDLHDVINTKYEDTPLVNENVFDLKEDLNVDLVGDLKKPTETSPSDSIPCQDASKDETSGVALLVRSICSDPPLSDSAFEINDRRVGDGLPLLESLSSDADLSEHSRLNAPVEGESLCVEKELNVNLSLVENVKEKKLECEAKVSCLNMPNNTEAIELELHNLDTLDHVEKQDCLDKNYQKKVVEKDLSGDKVQTTEEGQESVREEENVESVDKQKTDLMPDRDVIESYTSLRENEDSDTLNTQAEQDIGDVETSSSMEVDQPLETVEQNCSFIEDISYDKTGSDVQPGTAVENLNSMETDEIIPILEKLAPVEDVLQCLPKSPLRSGSVADEERADIAGTPSKIVSDCLPSEAFLVLSDEEEIIEKNLTKESSSNDDQVTKEAPQIEDQQKQDNAHDAFVEDTSEIFQRKRSKSEDLDSQISKRRRFEREEYEAELKVKITAGDDVNEKLQKVIQRMFEEKLGALQCADFDKAISELKMRVEKIECKKHENVLHSIQ
ncbi:activating transcription factor 7-interacting protein 1-like, partial [Hyperolius riggenbachi]|uniref:activating transcription factor 7-interacting protein 1-like n=1 Tax=Hyperolius riggenbachi TaxID=752182 RepID=UPI0035A32BDA